MFIHSFQALLLASLEQKEAPSEISREYKGYTDVFLPDQTMELLEKTEINKSAIALVEMQQSPYSLIYNFSFVELKILTIYIKIYLKGGFMQAKK